MNRFLSDILYAVAFFGAMLLCGFGTAHAASFPGAGCPGALDNVIDANGSFARCSVSFVITTSASDMVSCDGYTTPVAFGGVHYLACSSSWQKGSAGYAMAECPGAIGDDSSGHFVTCSSPWRSFVNRPPAIDPLVTDIISGTGVVFDFSHLDASKIAQFFIAGAASFLTFWLFGEMIAALLDMIRRGTPRS